MREHVLTQGNTICCWNYCRVTVHLECTMMDTQCVSPRTEDLFSPLRFAYCFLAYFFKRCVCTSWSKFEASTSCSLDCTLQAIALVSVCTIMFKIKTAFVVRMKCHRPQTANLKIMLEPSLICYHSLSSDEASQRGLRHNIF